MDDPRPTYDECPICHNPVCAASARGITTATRAALVALVHPKKQPPPSPLIERLSAATFRVFGEDGKAIRAAIVELERQQRDCVSVEDREQAWQLLTSPISGDTKEAKQARHLLKLEQPT